ncbi:MAG: hypothetical protein L0220_18665, partial [Acidobacteria bacterium]|nr:hypothetical protein [Acidobacteriota bacterium]
SFGFNYQFPSDHLPPFFYFKEQKGFILKLALMRGSGRKSVAPGEAKRNPGVTIGLRSEPA